MRRKTAHKRAVVLLKGKTMDSITVANLDVGRLFHAVPAESVKFLLHPDWDVVLVQNTYRDMVESEEFRRRFPVGIFKPMTSHYKRGGLHEDVGLFIGTNLPVVAEYAEAYVRHLYPKGELTLDAVTLGADGNANAKDLDHLRRQESRLVLILKLKVGGTTISIGTTHGAWRPKGEVDGSLRGEMAKFVDIVLGWPSSLVIAGNFSAARGGEIYKTFMLADMHDCLPSHITNAIDYEVRGVSGPDLAVDGIYTKGGSLKISDVLLHKGVSDHFGLSFTVSAG